MNLQFAIIKRINPLTDIPVYANKAPGDNIIPGHKRPNRANNQHAKPRPKKRHESHQRQQSRNNKINRSKIKQLQQYCRTNEMPDYNQTCRMYKFSNITD